MDFLNKIFNKLTVKMQSFNEVKANINYENIAEVHQCGTVTLAAIVIRSH